MNPMKPPPQPGYDQFGPRGSGDREGEVSREHMERVIHDVLGKRGVTHEYRACIMSDMDRLKDCYRVCLPFWEGEDDLSKPPNSLF